VLLIFWREEERTQEGAVDAIAKGELGGAQPREKLIGKARRLAEHGSSASRQSSAGFRGRGGRDSGAGHLTLAPGAIGLGGRG